MLRRVENYVGRKLRDLKMSADVRVNPEAGRKKEHRRLQGF